MQSDSPTILCLVPHLVARTNTEHYIAFVPLYGAGAVGVLPSATSGGYHGQNLAGVVVRGLVLVHKTIIASRNRLHHTSNSGLVMQFAGPLQMSRDSSR